MNNELLEKVTERVIVTEDSIVVVIDGDKLEREVLKGSINDSDVQRLLPFQTSLGRGAQHRHILNASAYTVETNAHFIEEGDTLCKRAAYTPELLGYYLVGGAANQNGSLSSQAKRPTATCPGCLAKAKSIIVNHLLDNSNLIG
jgi:hypothetical protein